MKTETIDFSKIGTSIISREAAESRRQFFLNNKQYWEQLEQKKGNHVVVKNMLWDMQELSKEFLVVPRLLEQFFFLYLNEHRPSQQNIQVAVNAARVYALLSHQYYKSATMFNMVASFWVSPSVWDKWLIGRKAKESSIKILQEMGVIIHYRYNRNKYAPAEESRIVTMYQFDLKKVKWLHGCIKTMEAFEETKQEEKYEGREYHYSYDDIMEDIFDFIENEEQG